LKQYLGKKDTGNTLGQNLILAKKCHDIDGAVDLISKFKIQAFEIHEMEYYLIQNCTNLLNQVGN
jgi:ADP-dependent phosphofructokinase/glucokinase